MGIKLYPYTATDTQAPSTTLSSASIINLNTKLSDFTYAKDATSATQDAVYYSKTYNWAPGTPSFGTNECYITNYLPFSIIVVVSEGVLVMKRIELAS